MFGRKATWLAVADAQPEDIAASLGLDEVRRETVESALAEIEHGPANPGPVLVVPPVGGWTLVLITSVADQEPWDLSRLSRRFGEVQRFVSHRVVDYFGWERWVDGHPRRRYAWLGESGEILADDGEPGAAEADIARASDLDGDWDDLTFPTEDTVLKVARGWSVDPTTIELPADPVALIGYVAPN